MVSACIVVAVPPFPVALHACLDKMVLLQVNLGDAHCPYWRQAAEAAIQQRSCHTRVIWVFSEMEVCSAAAAVQELAYIMCEHTKHRSHMFHWLQYNPPVYLGVLVILA